MFMFAHFKPQVFNNKRATVSSLVLHKFINIKFISLDEDVVLFVYLCVQFPFLPKLNSQLGWKHRYKKSLKSYLII